MNKAFENKKNRLSWTMKLHNKFVDAVKQLGGIEEAKPRNILELMDDENVTRANVGSHLQKYRLKKYRENMIKRSSSSVAHQQLGSLSGSGQFHNTAFNLFPTTELIGTSNSPCGQNMHEFCYGTNQFVQNNNTNGELNFQSPIGHGHENSITDASINYLTLVNDVVGPKANTPTNSTFNSNLDSNFRDSLQYLEWDLTEGPVTASFSSSQESALLAQLIQEYGQLIQFNSSTEPTLAFTPEQQQHQFVQNNTNSEFNFESVCYQGNFHNKYPDSLADMYSQEAFSTITPSQVTITDASINSVTLVNDDVDPKANTPTNSTFNSNLDSNFVDPLQDLMWDFNEGLVTASSSSSQVSALIAQLTQENDQSIQFNGSTEPTLAFGNGFSDLAKAKS